MVAQAKAKSKIVKKAERELLALIAGIADDSERHSAAIMAAVRKIKDAESAEQPTDQPVDMFANHDDFRAWQENFVQPSLFAQLKKEQKK